MALEKEFKKQNFLITNQGRRIAKDTGLTEAQVTGWFTWPRDKENSDRREKHVERKDRVKPLSNNIENLPTYQSCNMENNKEQSSVGEKLETTSEQKRQTILKIITYLEEPLLLPCNIADSSMANATSEDLDDLMTIIQDDLN